MSQPDFVPAQVRSQLGQILTLCGACDGSGFERNDDEDHDPQCLWCRGSGLAALSNSAVFITELHSAAAQLDEEITRQVGEAPIPDDRAVAVVLSGRDIQLLRRALKDCAS